MWSAFVLGKKLGVKPVNKMRVVKIVTNLLTGLMVFAVIFGRKG